MTKRIKKLAEKSCLPSLESIKYSLMILRKADEIKIWLIIPCQNLRACDIALGSNKTTPWTFPRFEWWIIWTILTPSGGWNKFEFTSKTPQGQGARRKSFWPKRLPWYQSWLIPFLCNLEHMWLIQGPSNALKGLSHFKKRVKATTQPFKCE